MAGAVFFALVLLILVVVLVVVLVILVFPKTAEAFRVLKPVPVPKTLLLTNDKVYSFTDATLIVKTNAEVDAIITSTFNNGKLPPSAGATEGIVTDSIDAAYLARGGFKNTIPLPLGCFVALAAREVAYHMECGYDFKNKRIGYLTNTEKHMTQAIARGHRLKDSEFTLEEVPAADWGRIDALIKQCRFDVVIVYLVPGSQMQSFLGTQDVSIFGFKGIDMDRVRIFYPPSGRPTLEEVNLAYMFQGRYQVMAREALASLICAPQYVVRIQTTKAPAKTTETFINRITRTEDDPEYSCYGDPTLKSRALCNSPYDVIGAPRQQEFPSVWDKPCKINADCPFFDKGTKTGGCTPSGTCKFPVGVRRLGWRKYTDTPPFSPFCHGCGPKAPPDCCKGDYVYADDQSFIPLE